jgi:hypothetical protein
MSANLTNKRSLYEGSEPEKVPSLGGRGFGGGGFIRFAKRLRKYFTKMEAFL